MMMTDDVSLPEPEFKEMPERNVVALARSFTMETRSEIPALWQEYWSAGWELPGEIEPAQYGVSFSVTPDGAFRYAVGVQVEPTPGTLPDAACIVTLSAGRYAVFRNTGGVQQIPETFDAIFSRWLPSSGESQREGAVYERYPYDENSTPESMVYEIWVPIRS